MKRVSVLSAFLSSEVRDMMKRILGDVVDRRQDDGYIGSSHNFAIRDVHLGEGGIAMEVERPSGGTWWALGWAAGIVAVAASVLTILLGPLHLDAGGNDRPGAVLAFVGVVVTAIVSIISLTLTRQANRRLSVEGREASNRLRLDAAMRAGESFSRPSPAMVAPASIASSLLALTKLDNSDLAIALLADFWSPDVDDKISNETAILVVDSALRSGKPTAQLFAAELLCRNAKCLDPCRSLDWPSLIDGGWDHNFGPKTKLLLVDALIAMTLEKKPVNGAVLRSVAVRLYGIFEGDRDKNVRGCIAILIDVLLPALGRLKYKNFMQGSKDVKLSDLQSAAQWAKPNDDDYLASIAKERSNKLRTWADSCGEDTVDPTPGALALAATNGAPTRHGLCTLNLTKRFPRPAG
jgi:hypothetical protein